MLLGYKGVSQARPLRMRLGLAAVDLGASPRGPGAGAASSAPPWRAVRLTADAPLFPDLCANVTPAWKCQVEDAFMWAADGWEDAATGAALGCAGDEVARLHMVFKDQHGVLGAAHAGGGIHATSADGGRTWRMATPRGAYGLAVRWAVDALGTPSAGGTGRVERLALRERTQLLRGRDGRVTGTHVYQAVCVACGAQAGGGGGASGTPRAARPVATESNASGSSGPGGGGRTIAAPLGVISRPVNVPLEARPGRPEPHQRQAAAAQDVGDDGEDASTGIDDDGADNINGRRWLHRRESARVMSSGLVPSALHHSFNIVTHVTQIIHPRAK